MLEIDLFSRTKRHPGIYADLRLTNDLRKRIIGTLRAMHEYGQRAARIALNDQECSVKDLPADADRRPRSTMPQTPPKPAEYYKDCRLMLHINREGRWSGDLIAWPIDPGSNLMAKNAIQQMTTREYEADRVAAMFTRRPL